MTEPEDSAVVAPPKADPEDFALRGRPASVVRFRRGLIVGVTGALAAAVVGVTWLALDPPSFRLAAGQEYAGLPAQRPASDALAGTPANYGDIPHLGPPLPGDLGRPILEHQRSLQAPVAPDERALSEADRGRAAADAERQRLAAERASARSSSLLVQSAGGNTTRAAAAIPQETPAAPSATGADESPSSLADPQSPWTLSSGTIIPASLITGLNSDLPGAVIAQVTENVRDSATGRTILIPQGARLVGTYESAVGYGQRRAMLAWQRILLPDGSSVRLDKMPAADGAGYAGVEGRVNFHTARLVKGVLLSTLLGVGSEISLGGGGELVRAVRESAQQNALRAGDQITVKNLDVKPTLIVRPGWPVRAIVNQDIVLRPWKG